MSPLLLPKQRGVRRESNYTGRPSLTWGTTLTSHTVAHQFPSTYTQLIASTSFDTAWVNVFFHTNGAAATDTDSLVTIYIGAGGAEQILIPTLFAGWIDTFAGNVPPIRYGFPLRIPEGSRLSARHQSVRTSTAVTCMIELLGGEVEGQYWVGTRVECVGANAATSGGTFVTPGSTSEGTLTSIGTNTYDWGFVRPMHNGNTDVTQNANLHGVDIGSGASTVISGLEDFLFIAGSTEWGVPISEGRYCHIPAGTTLYLRSQVSGTAESSDYAIYGVA